MTFTPLWRRTLRRPVSLRRLDIELDDGLLAGLDAVTSWRVLPLPRRELVTAYPNLVLEVALLLACVHLPPAPITRPHPTRRMLVPRRGDAAPTQGVLPLHFVPRAAYPVGYFLKTYYDCSPETMAGWTLDNLKPEVIGVLRRLPSGIADLVDRAYEGGMEARPCRATIFHS